MKYLGQAFWILFFYLLGLGVSMMIGGLIPGSVLGMVFLFGALALGWLREEQVSGVAQLLLDNMVLFFLPAAVGLLASAGIITANLPAIVTAAAISTVLIIIAVALTQQKMENRKRNRRGDQ